MTEAEWLAATGPTPMLEYLRKEETDRKFRLFAVACCRRVWNHLQTEQAQYAVDVTEKYADGVASDEHWFAAIDKFWEASQTFPRTLWTDANRLAGRAVLQLTREKSDGLANIARMTATDAAKAASGDWNGSTTEGEEPTAQCRLVRCIFGNPFRPVAFDPTWLTSTVLTFTEGIYTDRAFDRMPILADALQDAGCDNDDILTHCRQPGEHVRGCWVIDLILGKS